MKLSTLALSVGLPGRLKSSSTPRSLAYVSITLEMNSLPLSDLMVHGSLLASGMALGTRRISCPLRLCPTSISNHSRVNRSTTVSMRSLRPSNKAFATKSMLQI